jgi:hypothetical protein
MSKDQAEEEKRNSDLEHQIKELRRVQRHNATEFAEDVRRLKGDLAQMKERVSQNSKDLAEDASDI